MVIYVLICGAERPVKENETYVTHHPGRCNSSVDIESPMEGFCVQPVGSSSVGPGLQSLIGSGTDML